MAFTNQLNYPELFGNPVTVPYTLNQEQFVLNQRHFFKLHQQWNYALTDIVLSTDGTGNNIVPTSAYTLIRDDYYTESEKRVSMGGSNKVVYVQIIITNATYAGVNIYIKGASFGVYTNNNITESNRANKLDKIAPTTDSEVKTVKLNDTTDTAAARGAGTLRYSNDRPEFSNGIDWVPIGTGEDFQGINYENRNFEVNIDGYNTYKDAAQDTPEDGTGGTPTIISMIANTTNPLIGVRTLTITRLSAGNAQGEGISYDFSIDLGQRNKAMEFSFIYATGATDGQYGFFIYDIDNSQLIPTSVREIASTGGLTIPGQFYCTWNSTNSQNYRAIWHSISDVVSAAGINIDNIQVGPFNLASGFAASNENDYILNIGAETTNPTKGTIVEDKATWLRIGTKMEITYNFKQNTAGSIGSGTYLFPIPFGSIDKTKINNDAIVGSVIVSDNTNELAANTKSGVVRVYSGNDNSVYLQVQNVSFLNRDVIVGNTGFSLASANISYRMKFSIPIVGWGVNIKTASETTEYVSNSSSTDADDTNSFVTGPSIGIIGVTNLTGVRRKRIRFNTDIMPTDMIDFMIAAPGSNAFVKAWSNSSGSGVVQEGYIFRDANGGVTLEPVDSRTMDVVFWNTPFGAVSFPWGNVNLAGIRWYVRKTSGGNLAEVPPLVKVKVSGYSGHVGGTNPIVWTTVEEDTSSIYNSSNGTMLIPMDGSYLNTISVILNANTSDYVLEVRENTRGSISFLGQFKGVGTPFGISSSTRRVQLRAGEIISTTSSHTLFTAPALGFYSWELTRIGS